MNTDSCKIGKLKITVSLIGLLLATATFYYHAAYPYLSSPELQTYGLLLIAGCVSWAIIFVILNPQPKKEKVWENKKQVYLLAVMLGIGFLVHVVSLTNIQPWTEECYWIEIAKQILAGQTINPNGFKGDFPSNFFAWPVAFFIYFIDIPRIAARLPGVIYAILCAYFVCKLLSMLIKPRFFALGAFIPLFTLWTLHYSHTGWSEINSVCFLISIQWYYFVLAVKNPGQRNSIVFGCVCGLGFWSLYTPFLFSGIVGLLFVCLPNKQISLRLKSMFVITFLVISSATWGKMISYPEQSLGRQLAFLQGGEWQKFDHEKTPIGTYANTVKNIGYDLLPSSDYLGWHELTSPNLEHTTFTLLCAGLLLGLFYLSKIDLYLLYGPALLWFIGLVLSNPSDSQWRELGLAPFVFAFSGLALLSIVNSRFLLNKKLLLIFFVASFCVSHFYFFGSRYYRYINTRYDTNAIGHTSHLLHQMTKEQLNKGYQLLVPEGFLQRFVQAESVTEIEVQTYKEASEINNYFSGKPLVIVALDDDPEVPSRNEVANILSQTSKAFDLRQITDDSTSVHAYIWIEKF